MSKRIEAVIFDADGTILDTREMILQAIQHVLSEHGHAMPSREDLLFYGGRPAEETYRRFAPDDDITIMMSKQKTFQLEHLDLFAAYEGLDELITALKKAGLKIGICTSRRKNVIDLLRHVGVLEQFDGIMHADLVSNHKPHPEGVLKLCKEMNVEVSRAVMIGDTDADIGAGKAAGCAFTIGITHGIGTREQFEEWGADYIVDHLNDIVPLVVKK